MEEGRHRVSSAKGFFITSKANDKIIIRRNELKQQQNTKSKTNNK
jgi:hypothetical protein